MAMGIDNGGKGKGAPQPVVNVTPLVDVALVVLIIFMVVTPMMTKTFWINTPQQEEKEAPPPRNKQQPLVMTVDRQGVVRVNKTVIPKDQIKERLPRMLAGAQQEVLYFDAHDDVPYGTAVELMDLSRAGGARSIAILTHKLAQ